MVYFWDTSAAVKRYVRETGTGRVQSLTDPKQGHSHFLVRITRAEIVSAITRKEMKSRTITPANAATALVNFDFDLVGQYRLVEVSAQLVDRAALLARKHALRGYDAVQLAAALQIRSVRSSLVFASADVDPNAAAMAEGSTVEDPNNYP